MSDQDRTIPERPTAQRWWEYNPAHDEQRPGWRQW